MAITAEEARDALVAFQRFGLGPKPNALAAVAKAARKAVLAELDTKDIARISRKDLPSLERACRIASFGFGKAEALRADELDARIDKHTEVRIGFVERLVIFWSNHFSMSVDKNETVRGTIGSVERHVIRRHVLGRFSDMLAGIVTHPAMIAYLDNADSIGPNSPTGKSWGVGYNENLAREILELYTVGTGGGYTEADVTEFALALTGWSYVRGWEAEGHYNGGNDKNRGLFKFRRDWHEPGTRVIMKTRYADTGMGQVLRLLDDLAVHPKTAEHIAFKLVRHFVTDEPTPALVEPIAAVFRKTGGNLKKVAEALLALPEAWSAPLDKIRTPYELHVAMYRAFGVRYPKSNWQFPSVMGFLHQYPWACPSPEGWSDETSYWLAPDAMTIRLDGALLHARSLGAKVRPAPAVVAKRIYGKALSAETAAAIAAETEPALGLTAFLTSPEFQRR